MSHVTLPQILSIAAICCTAIADLAVIAILIIKRKKLKRGLRFVLVVLVILLTLVLAGLIGLSYASGSNQPKAPPQPYPIAGNEGSPSVNNYVFTRDNMPKLDGSTSTAPLAEAVCIVLLGESREEIADLVQFNKTTTAYYNLMRGVKT